MTDKPIIFSAPMVRALLDGRKTQTRRITKRQDDIHVDGRGGWLYPGLLPYAPGDRLYVREAFAMSPAVRHPDRLKNVIYRADVPATEPPPGDVLTMDRLMWACAQELKWKPSIHMPRWASRLTLTVTVVQVERLQEISEAGAISEGCTASDRSIRTMPQLSARESFQMLWEYLHGSDAWDANPWVCAISFTVERGNIDSLGS